MKCTSCGTRLESEENWVEFSCPSCGKQKILRCKRCKGTENVYTCKCGFEGP